MVKKAHFVVPLADLERGTKHVTWSIGEDWLREAFAATEATPRGEGELSLELSKNGRQVMVRGRASASVEMPCVRTLEPVPVELRPEIFLMLSPAPPSPGEDSRPRRDRGRKAGREAPAAAARQKGRSSWEDDPVLSEEDAASDIFHGEEIALDSFVREFLLLELPMTPMQKDLREAQAPAIAPAPADSEQAAEERLDPRLAPLAAFKSRLRDKKE